MPQRGRYEPFFIIWIDNQELPKNMLPFVRDFSFEDHEDKLDELKFTLLDPQMEFQKHPLLQKGKVVRAKWGYVDGLSQTKECTIQEPEYDFPENGVPTITIKALDKGTNLVKAKSQQCYHNVTGAEVAIEIAQRHNLKPVIHIPEDFNLENVAQGVSSDYEFIRNIAAERGCKAWVENNELHVAPYEIGKASRVLTYRMDGTGQIKSVKVKVHGTQGMAERIGTKVLGVDPLTKETIEETTEEKMINENLN